MFILIYRVLCFLQIYQMDRKGLETKLCPYLPQYLIHLLILNIHKVITPGFREIYDGSAVVQNCIPDDLIMSAFWPINTCSIMKLIK